MSRIRVIERGFLKGKRVFEKPVRWISDKTVADLAPRHAGAMADGTLDMIELEFPDCPEDDRFFRIGTSPKLMTIPIKIGLASKKGTVQ